MPLDGGPPAKRARTEQPTPRDIAQTNAHLQFIGGRQNRWMQALTIQDDIPPAVTNLRPLTRTTNAHDPSLHATSSGDMPAAGAPPPPSSFPTASNSVQQESPAYNQAIPALVAYEPGQTIGEATSRAPTLALDNVAVNKRTALDVTSLLPGLPSPAPSDENTNSPTFAERGISLHSHQTPGPSALGGPPAESVAASAPWQSPSASTAGGAHPQQQQLLQQHLQRSLRGHQSALLHLTQQAQSSPVQLGGPSGSGQHPQQQQHQHQNQNQHQHDQPPPATISVARPIVTPNMASSDSLLPTQPSGPPNQAQAHPQHQHQHQVQLHSQTAPQLPQLPQPHMSTDNAKLRTQALLARLRAKEDEIKRTTTLSATDTGRLMLLREAVERQDLFYQVLSQLFCLRTTSPTSLPETASDLSDKGYDCLATLLCSNADVNPELLEFFANFPEPIMKIYSGSAQARDLHDKYVKMVGKFLGSLPTQWDALIIACKSVLSPPLVQDLVQRLHLHSLVLQTTAFRAIARMFYGPWEYDSRGITAIESIHRIDQDSFYGAYGWPYWRNSAERRDAYAVLKHAYATWRSYTQALGQALQPSVFSVPQDVIDYFRQLPRSMQQPPPDRPSRRQRQRLQQLQQQQQLSIQQQKQQQQLAMIQQNQLRQQGMSHSQLPPQPQAQSAQLQQHQVLLQPRWLEAETSVTTDRVSSPSHYLPTAALQHQQTSSPSPPNSLPAFQMRTQTVHGHQAFASQSMKFYPHERATPRPQPTHPNPTISALHQVHLRSPVPGPVVPVKGTPRLYRHVVGFAVAPIKLNRILPSQAVHFNISDEIMAKIPNTIPGQHGGEPSRRTLSEDSLTFRLRCSMLPSRGFTSEHTWVTADNFWPDGFYFELNGTSLETRRRLHYGRYLPADVTSLLTSGSNILKVFNNPVHTAKMTNEYALAVEAVGVVTHRHITENIRRISAAEALSTITESLSGAEAGDDEVMVTSSSMTIQLFDPYSGCKPFDIPVRGAACLHKDCFDLEIFLRMCKRENDAWPTIVDCWRCPLCRGDVRPQTLVLDEFLLQVRDQLASQGLSDTRAIVIDANGTWTPKWEERTGVRSSSLEREERSSAGPTKVQTSGLADPLVPPARRIDVIELD